MLKKAITCILSIALIGVSTSSAFAKNKGIVDNNYIYVDNEKIYFENIGNKNSKKTVLLIHGASCTGESMRPLAMNLSMYNVVIIDLPQHYRSEGTARPSVESNSRFIKDLIKEMRKYNIVTEDITLAGHSMGGVITLDTAINHNINEIKRYIIMDSCAKADMPKDFIDKLGQGIFDTSFLNAAFTPYTPQAVLDYFYANTDKLLASVEASYIDFSGSNGYDAVDKLDKVKSPVLILGAELDNITPPELSKQMHDGIEGSQLIIYPKVGHMLPIEKASEISKDIINFIDNN